MDGGSTEIAGGESDLVLEGFPGWTVTSDLVIWSLVLLGAFVLNATLLFAFIKRSGLRTISNRFVMNLAVSNLLTCTVLNSLLIMDGVSSSSYESSLCALSEGTTALVTTSSVLSVLLIAVDQYFAVVDPLRYRTRIDKVKCGLLILAIWSAAVFFGMLASLNPSPRSFWHVCSISEPASPSAESWSETLVILNSSILLGTESPQSSECSGEFSCYLTYGFVYTVAYTILVFLLPFVGVCWIYVSIYTAARKNFERTRRTGSRPILSSNSFVDDFCYPVRQELGEEFRRIPKISSLSSIDESIESTSSQMVRSKSSECVKAAPKEAKSNIIFMLGAQSSNLLTKDDSKVPISTLRTEFLENNQWPRHAEALIRSKFPDMSPQKRKSSYDLMYDDVMRRNSDDLRESSDESCSDEEEADDTSNHGDQEVHSHVKHLPEIVPIRQSKVEAGSDSENEVLHEVRCLEPKSSSESSSFLGQNCLPGAPMVMVTPPVKSNLQRAPSTRSSSNYINNLKHRISNASLFKYREETRAARISALVIVMGLICWTPHVVVLILSNVADEHELASRHLDTLALSFLVLSTYVSPLLFGYRSKRVKRELRKFFCFRKELSYKNNRSLMAKKVLKRRGSGQLEMENRYSIFNCVYGRNRWPKEKVQFVQVPDNALAVETCRSSFSSGASTQISTTSTDEC